MEKKKCTSSNPANLLTSVEKSKVMHELFTSAMELDLGGWFYFLHHKKEGEKPLRRNGQILHKVAVTTGVCFCKKCERDVRGGGVSDAVQQYNMPDTLNIIQWLTVVPAQHAKKKR